MAYNCATDFKYYYPSATYANSYASQYYYPQYYANYYYSNAYQNQMRKLQNYEITMEYWIRQLEYFRNLLKNFSAQIETPEDLKRLLATCNIDENIKKCFEKRRTFYNIDKNCYKCGCKSCLQKLFTQLCNALSVPCPGSNNNNNKCNCSACNAKYPCAQNPQPCYYYFPYQQPYYQMPGCSYYYNPCQTMPQQFNTNSDCCPPNCGTCCNKCKLKNILNQINYILTSAEQLKCVPCTCNVTCCRKSCCSIKEIKEETVTIKREGAVENDTEKHARKSAEIIENEQVLSSPQNSTDHRKIDNRVSFDPQCECDAKNSNSKQTKKPTKRASESTRNQSNNYSEAETIDDASNISDECKNYEACVKKQASITLGNAYVSPSGNFEVFIEDQANQKSKKHNSNLVFQVDYTTYTKPKCDVLNEI